MASEARQYRLGGGDAPARSARKAAPPPSGFLGQQADNWPQFESQMVCTRQTHWMKAYCQRHGGQKLVPMRCKRCTGCLKLKALGHCRRIYGGLISVPGNRAWCVLPSPSGTSWPELMRWFHAWVKALRRYREQQGVTAPLEYAWTKEEGHKSGMKHLNVIFIGWTYVDWSLLLQWWTRASGGVATNGFWVGETIQQGRINLNGTDYDALRAARYAAKYTTKETLAGQRSVGYSKGWPKPPRPDSECKWARDGGEEAEVGMSYVPSSVEAVTWGGAVLTRAGHGGACAQGAASATEYDIETWLRRRSTYDSPGPLPPIARREIQT